jgi:hypothetical protein
VRYSPTVYSAFAPPPKLQLSTWMEEHIRLPAGDAAVPGKIRLYGYQRGIPDAIGDPLIERVTVIKSALSATRRCSLAPWPTTSTTTRRACSACSRSRTTPATSSCRRSSPSSQKARWSGQNWTPLNLTLTIGTRCSSAGSPADRSAWCRPRLSARSLYALRHPACAYHKRSCHGIPIR